MSGKNLDGMPSRLWDLYNPSLAKSSIRRWSKERRQLDAPLIGYSFLHWPQPLTSHSIDSPASGFNHWPKNTKIENLSSTCFSVICRINFLRNRIKKHFGQYVEFIPVIYCLTQTSALLRRKLIKGRITLLIHESFVMRSTFWHCPTQ